MASDQTKIQILDAAEKLLALEGFVATSHRRVADAAAVNLAAIRYHFGDKKSLFRAVIERRLRPLDQERLRRLDELEDKRKQPRVEDLVPALLDPMFALARSPTSGPLVLQLLARARVEPGDHWQQAGQLQAKTFKRFEKAFHKACPRSSPRTIAFRISFYLGSIATALIDQPTIVAAGGQPSNLAPVLPRLRKGLERLFIAGMKVRESS